MNALLRREAEGAGAYFAFGLCILMALAAALGACIFIGLLAYRIWPWSLLMPATVVAPWATGRLVVAMMERG